MCDDEDDEEYEWSQSEYIVRVMESEAVKEMELSECCLPGLLERFGIELLRYVTLSFSDDNQNILQSNCFENLLSSKFQVSWVKTKKLDSFENQNPTSMNIANLPSEILRKVFKFLSPEDLQNVVLVCRLWKYEAELVLWRGFEIPSDCFASKAKWAAVFAGSLFSRLQVVELDANYCKFKFNNRNFENFLMLNLTRLSLSNNIDLSNVSDKLFAEVVNNCRKFTLLCDLPFEQNKLEAVFEQMASHKTKLKSFLINAKFDDGESVLDLSNIPPIILTKALVKLESLALIGEIRLSEIQLKAIFGSSLNLKKLNLVIDFGLAGVEVLDPVLGNLTELRLMNYFPDTRDTRHVLKILDKTCNLKKLDLLQGNVIGIPAELVARVVNKVETVELSQLRITGRQFEAILKRIIEGKSAMKHLCLTNHNARTTKKGLGKMFKGREEVFAKAVNKLESVDLGWNDMSEELIKAFFRVMSEGTELKMLGTFPEHNDLEKFDHIRKVDPVILARAVNNLESVKIDMQLVCGDGLTDDQKIAIFKHLNLKTKLKAVIVEKEDRSGFDIFNV